MENCTSIKYHSNHQIDIQYYFDDITLILDFLMRVK